MRRSSRASGATLLLLLLVGLPLLATEQATEAPAPGGEKAEVDNFLPPPNLRPGWYARLETTMGRIVIRLLPHQAPHSVAHFAALADGRMEWIEPVTGQVYKEPYYDGILVTKAIGEARFEAGDARTDGRFAPIILGPEEGRGPINFFKPYRVGMLMADTGHPSAVTFFITVNADAALSLQHNCFAEVVRGQEIVRQIANVRTYNNDRPLEDVVIEKVRTFKVGEPAALPDPAPYTPTQEAFGLNERLKKKRRRMNGAQ